jgi:hypothetical protein
MKRLLVVLPVLGAGVIAAALFLHWNGTSAVQAPTMALDMNPAANTYDETTNTMSVVFDPNTDFCLASATADPAQHNHPSHLIIQNVEDLVGWQARLNYDGGQMRPLNQNVTPFTDNTTAQNVGFTNLPIDSVSSVHRDVTAAASIPAQAAGPQTALLGGTYNGTFTAAQSPDTPAKTPPDDASYNAPSGGVLALVTFQVLAGQTGTLTVDLSDDQPNPPGTKAVIFSDTGTNTEIFLAETSLGDAQHVEGGVCAAATPQPTPSATETPAAGSATATPTRAPGGATGGTATATPAAGAGGAAGSRTPTPRLAPAALPPTGNSDDGGPSVIAYALLLGAISVPASAAGYKVWRLRRR